MCGIAGFFPGLPKDKSIRTLGSMMQMIRHRGPDESGMYVSTKVAMGSMRLSIIGLEDGTMPISNENEKFWIVFNGEVYNYVELKKDLENMGYGFKTASDTEVILKLFEEHGVDSFKMLNGQFSIAIFDKEKDQLILVRDRVGIRPLFYTHIKGYLVFASELKCFLEYPGIDFKICKKALSEYFTFWTCLSPKTLFKDIYQVPAGSYLRINSSDIEIVSYWSLFDIDLFDESPPNIDLAKKEFEALFKDSVRLRLRSDVEVGSYLSGGLDSTITTYFAKDFSKEKLRTFSIGFDEASFDETPYQVLAQKEFRTNHSKVSFKSEDTSNEFESAVWHAEAPLFRTSPIPMKVLAKKVHEEGMKVIITGEGADEILAGYNIFKESKIRRFWAKIPESKIRPLLLKRLYPYLPHIHKASPNLLKIFFGYRLTDIESPVYSHFLRWSNNSKLKGLFSDHVSQFLKDYDPVLEFKSGLNSNFEQSDDLTKAQLIEMELFMSGYLLSSQGDRMAMAHSVEGRYPFLDHRIIEYCLKLPQEFKMKGLREKQLLKSVMKGRIPKEILDRPKQAYRAPIKSSFAESYLKQITEGVLSVDFIRKNGIFDEVKVHKLLKKFEANKSITELDKMGIVGVLSVQLLFSQFIMGNYKHLVDRDNIELDKLICDYE